ncbi:PhzF family phenazine biosynthesis protein [uncultured Shimia sp.]|uniref:PhzF family phenazine biosynthesis protein n=1 Tax=uncultured Shimia sp. TaxID=573152 RepID=UPI002610C68C|nr:PhzF family phenazine biosynthesis protein [uncultured Shimia sp.]
MKRIDQLQRRFIQADVFSPTPTLGNGLAVVVDADGMSDDEMQAFAAWTNLAETTFLLPPTTADADYRLRIFTPGREMLFAGHPTLGSCAAWLHSGNAPARADVVRQECAIGIVDIDLTGAAPAFVSPPTRIAPMDPQEKIRIINTLGIEEQQVKNAVTLDNGPVWQLLELNSAAEVLAVDETRVRWPEFVGVSLFGALPKGGPFDYETRNISPSSGMSEDPITGSLNAAIACWLLAEDRLPDSAIAAQGTKMGRSGRVYYRRDPQRPGKVLIGGQSHILIEGVLNL